jgi:bifunctional ADP-heptose synthase (sugar kinase/adenylyltransferase)
MIKILVIGETCSDKFVYCEVPRFCPEAPVPILRPIEIIENEGMSGNVVRNLKSISSEINITHIHQREIINKSRFIEKKSNHMFIRLDEGDQFISKFEDIIEFDTFDIIIVSDYNKGFLSDDDLITISKKSKLSILDSKRKLKSNVTSDFTFVKLNESEYNSNQDISSDNIIVTLGSKGSMFNSKIYSSDNPQETIDVSGAGDTFTSSFILKFYQTQNIEESIIFANKMSAIVVSKRGVATPF